MDTFALTSPAFEPNGTIPEKYTCDGAEVSPPLSVSGVPEGTKSLALIMDDPDIPQAVKEKMGLEVFDHWVVFNIPLETTDIPEGTLPGIAGLNSSGTAEYTGPCPPPQYEPREHRYIFTLYALSGVLDFSKAPTKKEILDAIPPLLIAQAQLIGRYSRG